MRWKGYDYIEAAETIACLEKSTKNENDAWEASISNHCPKIFERLFILKSCTEYENLDWCSDNDPESIPWLLRESWIEKGAHLK